MVTAYHSSQARSTLRIHQLPERTFKSLKERWRRLVKDATSAHADYIQLHLSKLAKKAADQSEMLLTAARALRAHPAGADDDAVSPGLVSDATRIAFQALRHRGPHGEKKAMLTIKCSPFVVADFVLQEGGPRKNTQYATNAALAALSYLAHAPNPSDEIINFTHRHIDQHELQLLISMAQTRHVAAALAELAADAAALKKSDATPGSTAELEFWAAKCNLVKLIVCMRNQWNSAPFLTQTGYAVRAHIVMIAMELLPQHKYSTIARMLACSASSVRRAVERCLNHRIFYNMPKPVQQRNHWVGSRFNATGYRFHEDNVLSHFLAWLRSVCVTSPTQVGSGEDPRGNEISDSIHYPPVSPRSFPPPHLPPPPRLPSTYSPRSPSPTHAHARGVRSTPILRSCILPTLLSAIVIGALWRGAKALCAIASVRTTRTTRYVSLFPMSYEISLQYTRADVCDVVRPQLHLASPPMLLVSPRSKLPLTVPESF